MSHSSVAVGLVQERLLAKSLCAEKEEFEHPEQRYGWDSACIQNSSVAGVGVRNPFTHTCVWWFERKQLPLQ